MTTPITIYRAKQIVTMNPSNPTATHVAVRDGLILGAGTLDELKGWGKHELDDTFKHHVLTPGFVEAHAHLLEGAMAQYPYAGLYDRRQPDGTIAKGIKNYDELITHLKQIHAKLEDPHTPMFVQGFDPIYFSGERLTLKQLDEVSTTRPIFIIHASGHLATCNTATLKANNITRDAKTPGVAAS